MTPLRLLPAVRPMTQAQELANRAALLAVAVEVRRELVWNPRLRQLVLRARRAVEGTKRRRCDFRMGRERERRIGNGNS